MKKRKIFLISLIVIILALVSAGIGFAAAEWACHQGAICPVVMRGVGPDSPSYLLIHCWDDFGSGEVEFWRIGGNDYVVSCE